MAFLCLSLTIIAQNGTITYSSYANPGSSNVSIDVFYNNQGVFLPNNIDVIINLSSIPVSANAQPAPGSTWSATYNGAGNRVEFSGAVTSGWNSANGAANLLGTITFMPNDAGCLSFVSAPSSLLISFGPPPTGKTPPSALSESYCTFDGQINLAAGTSALRTRLIQRIDQVSGIGLNAITVGTTYDFPEAIQLNPDFTVAVNRTLLPPLAKFNGNIDIFDVVAILNHILGSVPFTQTSNP